MNFSEYKYLVRSDLYRYTGLINKTIFFKHIRDNPGFQYTLWMRTCNYLYRMEKIKYITYIALRIATAILKHYTYKYGISIPFITQIGSGFYIGHFGCIVVHKAVKIGRNCNISQGVTIGISNRGIRKGCPVLGDNVFIGPGAKIIGNIKIGDNVAIGANCVVTKDIPDNAVVIGVPGRVISFKGSIDYINRIDY